MIRVTPATGGYTVHPLNEVGLRWLKGYAAAMTSMRLTGDDFWVDARFLGDMLDAARAANIAIDRQ